MKYRPGKIIFTTLLVFVVAVALCACVTDTGGEHDNTHQNDNNQTGGDDDPVTYTITFESNGGSIVAAITAEAGATVTAPAAPTKTNFMFDGWYSDSGLTTAYTFDAMPSQNVTLYAAWSENLTEAEYKVMVEEKLKEAIKKSYDADKVNKVLNRAIKVDSDNNPIIDIVKIDTNNGIVYGYTEVTGLDSIFFISAEFNKDILNESSYKDIKTNIEIAGSYVEKVSIEKSISTQVERNTYDAFLNSVVIDPGFKTAVEGAGINLPSGINDWTDIATVVNAKVLDTGNIDVLFVDIITNKTISIRVNSHLTVQESSTVPKQVKNTTIKNKVITVVGETKDFSTLPDVE